MLLLQSVSYNQFSYDQIEEIKRLHGKSFNHKIEFDEAVFYDNEQWGLNGARLRDKGIKEKKIIIENLFRVSSKDKNKSDRH
jgi:hypothetical protein